MAAIQPADIEMLTRELNLRETTPATLEALITTFGSDRWFAEFMALNREVVFTDDGKQVPAPGSSGQRPK